jgi:hypothetical protein
MTTPTASFDAQPAPQAQPAGLWEDLIDVFTAPVAVFTRRRDGRFWLAMLVFTLLGAASFAAARPAMQPLFDRQAAVAGAKLDANPQLSAEQREAAKRQMRAIGDSPWALAGGVLVLPMTLLSAALALWLVGKAFGSGASYGQSLAVVSVASIPRAVLGVLGAGAAVALGRQVEFAHQLTVGPGTMMGDVGPVLGAVLQRLDLGVLWHTVLIGIGLSLMGRVVRRVDGPAVEGQISRGRGLAAAFVVWLLATLLVVWQGYSQSLA